MPKVSAILSTHNGEKYLAQAIKSVLRQSFEDWELLVVDDGSTALVASGVSLAEKIVQEFTRKDSRIIYLKNEQNLGLQKSLNRGLQEAQGEYIARVDDDDEWVDEDKLKNQVEFLDKNPDYVLAGTGVIVINQQGNELFRFLSPGADNEIRKRILGQNCFSHSSVLFRKEAAFKAGLYPETKKTLHVEDYYLWLKLGQQGKFHNLPIYGIKFMIRPGAIGSRHKLKQFWHDILLSWEFRNKYPNFLVGFIRSWLRLIFYGLGGFLPFLHLKYRVMKKYKSS